MHGCVCIQIKEEMETNEKRMEYLKISNKPSLSLYSPYYAEACNELAVPFSTS